MALNARMAQMFANQKARQHQQSLQAVERAANEQVELAVIDLGVWHSRHAAAISRRVQRRRQQALPLEDRFTIDFNFQGPVIQMDQLTQSG